MFKMALFDCAINEKCCSVDGGRYICPLISSPPWGFDSSRVPTPRNFPSKAKKMLMPGGQLGGGGVVAGHSWNWLMHNFLKKKNIKLLITFQKQHLAIKIIEKQSTTVLKPSNFGIEKGKPGQKFALSPPWPTIYHFRSFDLPWWQSAPLPNLSRHHT